MNVLSKLDSCELWHTASAWHINLQVVLWPLKPGTSVSNLLQHPTLFLCRPISSLIGNKYAINTEINRHPFQDFLYNFLFSLWGLQLYLNVTWSYHLKNTSITKFWYKLSCNIIPSHVCSFSWCFQNIPQSNNGCHSCNIIKMQKKWGVGLKK